MNITRAHYADNRTIKHEFGHTLGLLHEHQRWDRGDYLNMPRTSGSDYKRIKKNSKWGTHFLSFERRRGSTRWISCRRRGWSLRCKWTTLYFYHWVPVWKYHAFDNGGGDGSKAFDCKSIMLYGDIRFRDGKCLGARNSNGESKWYKEISDEDARAIRRIY